MRRVLVLGGGGFVGAAIARVLADSGDFSPVVASRTSGQTCDATCPRSMEAACDNITIIVNAVMGNDATLQAATRIICDIALRKKIFVVHLSSMAVYGTQEGVVGETASLQVGARGYAASKIACEIILQQHFAGGGQGIIFRPGVIVGPGSQPWVGRLCRLLRAGRLGDLGEAGDGFCNLITAHDVGAATLSALRAHCISGVTFNLATPEPPRWNEVLRRFAHLTGALPLRRITARKLQLETKLVAPLLLIAKKLRVRATAIPELVAPSMLSLMGQQIILDHQLADASLGFARTPLDAALGQSAAWFMQQSA